MRRKVLGFTLYIMTNRFYVYILASIENEGKYYVGYTEDIEKRIADHNSGTQTYSKRYAPWRLVTYIVFSDMSQAKKFEKYLKSHSGRTFYLKNLV